MAKFMFNAFNIGINLFLNILGIIMIIFAVTVINHYTFGLSKKRLERFTNECHSKQGIVVETGWNGSPERICVKSDAVLLRN